MSEQEQKLSPQMERRVGQDALRANRHLIGARVVSTWITEPDGWLALELRHEGYDDDDDDEACTVLVNPIDIRFRTPQAEA